MGTGRRCLRSHRHPSPSAPSDRLGTCRDCRHSRHRRCLPTPLGRLGTCRPGHCNRLRPNQEVRRLSLCSRFCLPLRMSHSRSRLRFHCRTMIQVVGLRTLPPIRKSIRRTPPARHPRRLLHSRLPALRYRQRSHLSSGGANLLSIRCPPLRSRLLGRGTSA